MPLPKAAKIEILPVLSKINKENSVGNKNTDTK